LRPGKLVYIAFAIMCCVAGPMVAFAQKETRRRPTIAVLGFENRQYYYSNVNRELSDALINELLKSEKFTVVDRARTELVVREQIGELTGTVDPASAAKIGGMTGAQYLIVGSLNEFKQTEKRGLGIIDTVLPGSVKSRLVTYRASVRFTLQIIQSTTAEIKFSQSFKQDISEPGLSGGGGLFDLPTSNSNAMQKAVENAMTEAARVIEARLASATPPPAPIPPTPSAGQPSVCDPSSAIRSKRIMVVIPEVHLGQRIPDPAGETEIIKKLLGSGFNLVDQRQIAAIRDREKVLTAVKNPQAAVALGVEFGADIIIIGEAFSEFGSRSNGLISTRARVEAKAIQTDTGRIIAADGKFGTGLDIAEFVSGKTALRNAGTQWADYFLSQVCNAQEVSPASSGVEILVSNVRYEQAGQFADLLEKVAGVRKVDMTLTGNIARLNVQFDGPAKRLADAISKSRFGLLRVSIIGLSGNKIEMEIGK